MSTSPPLPTPRAFLPFPPYFLFCVAAAALVSTTTKRSAIRFTTFERVSGWLQEGQGEVHILNALAAGTLAGAVESATCLTPLQNIQIKMTQDADAPRQARMYRCDDQRRRSDT